MKKIFLLLILAIFTVMPLPAQQRDAVRYYEELIGTMSQRVKQLQDENAQLAAKVAELQRQQSSLTQANRRLTEEMNSIRDLVRQDAENRKKELQKLHAQLKKLSEMPVPAVPAPVIPAAASADTVYEEYTVEAGATLSAIAGAYDVSIKEIKRVNGLKSDFLRIGQKLKIPVRSGK